MMNIQINDIAQFLRNSYFYDKDGNLKRHNSGVSELMLLVDKMGCCRYTSPDLTEVLKRNSQEIEAREQFTIAELFAADPEMAQMVIAAIDNDCCIETDLEVGTKTLLMRVFPFVDGGLVLLRDVTEIRMTQHHVKKLTHEVQMLTEKLETRKRADRAKGILMARGMDESEAFKRIRKAAMDSGKTLNEVADAIILADSLNATGPS